MKILFISRAYPPIVGGIENQNFELSVWLQNYAQVKTIANKHGRKFLPFFAPFALLQTIFILPKYDVILLGDGVLAILAWFIKLFSKKPIICVIHGLDINYNSSSLGVWYEKILVSIYQKLWIKIFLQKIDKFIAVGNETIKVAQEHGIVKEKIVFIPNGIDTEKFIGTYSKKDLESILKENLENKRIIMTSGRLAKRKGVAWFCENVMPKLAGNIIYVIAGEGPDRKNIEKAIQKNNLKNRVKMLGYVTDETREILWNTADLFIQPNIKIKGDMEGFGLSTIEATSCKLPVIVSNLEGLKDAIKENENGFLIEPYDTEGYVKKINELLADDAMRKQLGEKARQFAIDNYQWKNIAKKYFDEIAKVAIKK